jgi:hypothetical protein
MLAKILTNLVQHLVTLIKYEDLAATEAQELVPNQGVQSTRSGHNDVRMSIFVFENFGILLDRGSSVEHSGLHLRHVFAESRILILDLVGELTSVTHNKDRGLTGDWLNLLKGGKDEYSSLPETGLGLAENIGSENCLRNAYLLDCNKPSRC